jgi:hypothetical protein
MHPRIIFESERSENERSENERSENERSENERSEKVARVLSLFTGMGGMDIGFAEEVVVRRRASTRRSSPRVPDPRVRPAEPHAVRGRVPERYPAGSQTGVRVESLELDYHLEGILGIPASGCRCRAPKS